MSQFLKVLLLINGLWINTTSLPPGRSDRVSPTQHKTGKIQYGIASYYADKFNGRSMANGEIFNQKKMTAASNTLSLNTWVRVTNLRNMKTALVKITDRMHPKNKRLIDLSKAAARELEFLLRGLTRVKVEVLGKKRP